MKYRNNFFYRVNDLISIHNGSVLHHKTGYIFACLNNKWFDEKNIVIRKNVKNSKILVSQISSSSNPCKFYNYMRVEAFRYGVWNTLQKGLFHFNCILANHIFTKTSYSLVPQTKTLGIIGNGVTAKNINADLIVRFNNAQLSQHIGYHTDILVINDRIKKHCRKLDTHPFSPLILNLECEYLPKIRDCKQNTTYCVPDRHLHFHMCRGAPSRGFIFAALFSQLSTKFVGFSGTAHYFDKKKVWHDVQIEHRVLKEMGNHII